MLTWFVVSGFQCPGMHVAHVCLRVFSPESRTDARPLQYIGRRHRSGRFGEKRGKGPGFNYALLNELRRRKINSRARWRGLLRLLVHCHPMYTSNHDHAI